LLILCILCLSGCNLFSDDGVKTESGFFSVAYLTECKLSDMPIPSSDVMGFSNAKVYCNLSAEEYESYTQRFVAYLLAKEDIYYKGYHYETGNPGGIFFLPEYRFAPLTPESPINDYWFAFSLTESLNETTNDSYWNGITVRIERKDGKTASFAYNTIIEIDNDPSLIVYHDKE
ncbi:MAG: hypothetical protein IKY62_00350, partial [Clostridia bacterium]|nr:hypothetical protein [Clostridia bacterium]